MQLTSSKLVKNIQQSQMVTSGVNEFHFGFVCLFLGIVTLNETIGHWNKTKLLQTVMLPNLIFNYLSHYFTVTQAYLVKKKKYSKDNV